MPTSQEIHQLQQVIAEHQAALAQFLDVEFKLGLTFVQTAAIDRDLDPAHANKLMSKAEEALATARRFTERLEDSMQRRVVEEQAGVLEGVITAFWHENVPASFGRA